MLARGERLPASVEGACLPASVPGRLQREAPGVPRLDARSTRLSVRIVIPPVRERRTMPEYAPGTPSWVELSSPDTDTAAKFYGELMGWNAPEGAPETGGYRMFQQDGNRVAGLMGHMQEGQPTAW